ncbi:cytosolic sulfotransferase 15-like [Cornus florida]|uniref:cytosolic sulfotransferase 15-like n=1 Tax=Cornus florida TaxID=4283 RepID=UPI0028972EC5|nr:cytosolic sulfotransferase 15-like [Cornus florida]
MEQKDVPRSCLSMEGDGEDELLQTLPRERNWGGTSDLCQFQGFWCPLWVFHGLISFQKHFQAHATDLILASAPKTGTTWSKALVFAIVNRTRYGFNDNPLLTANPHDLVPFLEMDLYLNRNNLPNLEDRSDPRLLSTHVPFASLPVSIIDSGCRIVYVCRNPFDQLISHWHFTLKRSKENADHPPLPLEECFERYCKGVISFGPFWDHVLGYWKASLEKPNKVLFLKYEDLKEDAKFGHLKKLAEFLGFPFSGDEERDGVIEQVSNLCSFENLKSLEVNNIGKRKCGRQNTDFFREGKVGDWANYLTPSMAQRLNNLVEEKLAGSGLTFRLLH